MIEKEFKFILDLGFESKMNDLTGTLRSHVYDIQQGYLSQGGRVRSKRLLWSHGILVPDPVSYYYFTYKEELKNHPNANLEFEMEIPSQSFELAWSQTVCSLSKRRHAFVSEYNETWEIDFLKTGKTTYAAIAECEVPFEQIAPRGIPHLLEEHIILVVKDDDNRWTNKKMCDEKRTRDLLKSLKK